MKPSTELFDLIQSLSKSEKRFFKLSSSLQSGDKNYLKIFDSIDKQSDYDESGIKEQFKDETFIKHFPSEKNHLYKLILKSLRAYHSDNSASSLLKQEIKNIEILYNKALFKECNKFLMRAKKMAIIHEKFYFLFELISWEKLLLEEAFEDGEFTKDLDSLIREEQEIIEKLRNLAAYHVLYSKINYVFRSGGYVRNDEDRQLVQEIANHPLIKGKNTALSKRAASICYYTQGFCSLANGDYEKAYVKFEKTKQILDDNPKVRKDLSKRYVRALSNMISCQIDLGNFVGSKMMIEELKNSAKMSGFNRTDIQVNVFKDTKIGELKICHQTGDFDKGLIIVDEVIESLEEWSGLLHKEQELEFFYHIAYIYFGAGKFNKALFWINKVLNDNENTLRQDLYSYARLFNLVIHFELANFDLLEYITKSTQRYLHKRQRDFEFEKLVIDMIRKLIRLTNVIDRKEMFIQFSGKLEELAHQPGDRVVLKYFDFRKWVDSKIDNATFSEAIKKAI
ncbi:MAG: tetratricopeptide (TPR) repeat protein [Flavobacteriales bacterium]|jgi:tetratricopeptide (TPR) repeat protein